ncbi:MAG: c-type cytochrome [Saprospiraceae bacterium]|nr:c-type cytochrome [Saprospiraceae bacterium]MDW8485011.1 cytochrome c peroxidase [Saprospiraceae bacterium]
MKRVFHFGLPLVTSLLLLTACEQKPDFEYYYYEPEDYALLSQYLNLPQRPDNYSTKLPKHLEAQGLFARAVDQDKAILGRVLFYDKNLSKDKKVSCASCHRQEIAFSDDKPVSRGVFDRVGTRNSIALGSVLNFSAYYGTDLFGPSGIPFFWDNRANTASEQNLATMTNPVEMDMKHPEIVDAVKAQPYYAPLFRMAYGDETVTIQRISEAIANFVNAIGSYRSKFDREAEKTIGTEVWSNRERLNFSGFTPAENRGKQIYLDNCASCHSPLQGRPMKMFANNGLDATITDKGVGGITNQPAHMGMFKVPLLRNIALTAPYMHDGRFATLEEVIDHYSTGIKPHPNLSPELRLGSQPRRFNFTPQEKSDLIAFLHTLTDEELLVDKRFSNPFK